MIRLLPVELPQHALDALHGFQRRVDAGATYADQVVLAKRLFPQQNKPKNKTFNAVKHALTELCSGARRCCYCEDSVADEVEHIKPKDLYPEVVFAWENYLYACGRCNGPKNNGFAVFATDDGRVVDVRRARGAPVLPPTPGAAVLIDPRWEDPLEYMELDLLDTFVMVPLDDADSPRHQRAAYTIELLGLNRRDYLLEARAQAYHSYRAHLVEYIHRRDNGVAPAALHTLISVVKRMSHPTVWREMQRQQQLMPELETLFSQAPEALTW